MVSAARLFEHQGFLLVDLKLSASEQQVMQRQIDEAVDTGRRKATRISAPTELSSLGMLPAHPILLKVLSTIMPAGQFAVQHLQCDRHEPGTEALPWHHDHLCSVTPAPGLLVYAFIYPSGLEGSIGDLLLLPGSHRVDAMYHRLALAPLLGTEDLPPCTITLDHVQPGTAVLLHGRLLHARRPPTKLRKRRRASAAGSSGDNSGSGRGRSGLVHRHQTGTRRYFVDIAYCSTGRLQIPPHVHDGWCRPRRSCYERASLKLPLHPVRT